MHIATYRPKDQTHTFYTLHYTPPLTEPSCRPFVGQFSCVAITPGWQTVTLWQTHYITKEFLMDIKVRALALTIQEKLLITHQKALYEAQVQLIPDDFASTWVRWVFANWNGLERMAWAIERVTRGKVDWKWAETAGGAWWRRAGQGNVGQCDVAAL